MNRERTTRLLSIFPCSALVMFSGWLSVRPEGPTIVSPNNLLIAIPASIMHVYWGHYSDGVIVILLGILFLVWSLPAFRSPSIVPVRSIILLGCGILLSGVSIVCGWSYGLKWQSRDYMIGVACVNLFAWSVLAALTIAGRTRQTYSINIAFHILLFIWLSWYAMPWTGEML